MILFAIILASLRYGWYVVYPIFMIGLICIIPAYINRDVFRFALYVLLPIVALYVPILLPHTIPGLIKIGSIIIIWTCVLLVLSKLFTKNRHTELD